MEKSGKRGKIPQSDWPLIMTRYEAGETLASIARTYDCSPPAISYVVSRSRTRQPALPIVEAAKPPPPAEPQLLKSSPGEAAAVVAAAAKPPPPPEPVAAAIAPDPAVETTASSATAAPQAALRSNGHAEAPHRDGGNGSLHNPPRSGSLQFNPPPRTPYPPSNSTANPGWQQQRPAQANGDHRRKLHLSLGNPTHGNAPQGNGFGHAGPPETAGRSNVDAGPPAHVDPERTHNDTAAAPRSALPPAHYAPNMHAAPEPGGRKDGAGSFIDLELRTRVEGDITAFLAAFDAALAQDSPESRSGLREATDRLLRAGARTRIELERLEARIPLTTRGSGADRAQPAWRDR